MKKDKNPYIIFRCSRCGRYLYAKTTQKTKKCLACGYTHHVKKIHPELTVEGMSTAVETIKQKQDELARNELGRAPDFHTNKEFQIAIDAPPNDPKSNLNSISNDSNEIDEHEKRFRDMLKLIKEKYGDCPQYVIDIMAVEFQIPESELKLLLRKYLKNQILTRDERDYYILKNVS